MIISKKLTVTGVVQGVGFRPFVYALAKKYALKGSVQNSSAGVIIYAEGDSVDIKSFENEIKKKPPVLAKIQNIKSQKTSLQNYTDFEILKSEGSTQKQVLLPPDIAICDECKSELNDEKNRRYAYPLTNCTNCGPRYTIINALPYDRPNTSMGVFEMCDECKGEYENPLDRRFHAEPISCPKCGPKLTFSDKNGIEIKCEDPVKMCADELKKGKIIAIKGLGGFHLACDATDFVAVESLRIRKRRAKKPLAVMFKTVDGIQKICKVNKKELSLLVSRHAPIVILKKKKKFSLVQNLSFESGFLGVFLPYTPLQLMLFSHIDFPLVMTSANISEEPIITEFDELIKKLGNVVDFVLDFDRKVINGCDDSVVRVFGGHQIFLRLARGYAPMNSNISGRFEIDTLAMGAQQKSTISFGIKNLVVTSAHIADLFSVESIQKYKNTIKSLSNLYGFEPRMVVNDKNIAYESTKYAKEFGVKTIGLQHHKAHFLAGLYEAKLLGREALGVIFDGTGLGDDGTVWGGEFFVYKNHKIVRACHLKEFWLLGGEASAKHPNRSALAILFDIYGDEVLEMKNHTTESFTSLELRTLLQLHKTGANSIRTSSIGRLFDAVASHIGLVQKESYDGESGLLIESKYDSSIKSIYDVKISDKIDFSEVFRADDGPIKGASKFLNTLAFVIGEVASKYNLPIVFSGGVFQNATLCQLVSKELKSRSLKAHFHKNLSPNDSSISIGQAIYGRMNDPAFCNRNPCS